MPNKFLNQLTCKIGLVLIAIQAALLFRFRKIASQPSFGDRPAPPPEPDRGEAALRDQIQSLTTLLETIPNPVFYKDREGRYTGCNRAFEEYVGRPREEIIGKTVYDLGPKEVADKYYEKDQDLFNQPGSQVYEWQVVPPSGVIKSVIFNKVALIDSEGQIKGLVGVISDITERKRMEMALRESEERYRDLFQTLVHGVVYHAADGRIISANPAAERILGLSLDQMQGRRSIDPRWRAIHEDGSDFPGETHPAIVALRTGQAVRNTVMGVFNPQTENYTWININAIPQFRPGETQPYQTYAMFEDITERRRAEDALHQRVIALTEPLDSSSTVQFTDLFNLEEIQKIQDAFAEVAGVGSIITRPDGVPLTRPSNFSRLCLEMFHRAERGQVTCYHADALLGRPSESGPIIQTGLGGCLRDGGASITVGGKHIANWLIGKVRDEVLPEDQVRQYAAELNFEPDEFRAALAEIPVMSPAKFEKIAQALFVLAKELSLKAYQNMQQARFITERKRAEVALRDQFGFLRTLLDTIPNPVFYRDLEGRFLDCNHAMAAFTGKPRKAIVGKTLHDLFPAEVAACLQAKDQELFDNPGIQIYQQQTTNGRGDLKTVILHKAPVSNTRGRIMGLVGVMSDITEQKQVEEELKRHQANLEEMVRARTDELMVAKDKAEAASRAKSAFLANMSHELRTPLNAVLGYAQLLQQKPLDKETLDRLAIIQESGQHLLALINDVLDLSKIEAHKLELHPAAIHLPSFLKTIVEIIQPRATSKGLHFTFESNGPLPAGLTVDETRLRQVLLNLLSNAVKFTPAGHMTLRVKAQPASQLPDCAPCVRLRFDVEDSGVGISPDQIEQAFHPFEQVGDLNFQVEGTGLGLPICRQLVHLMGGQLHVQSEPNRGSLFWFEIDLPLAESPEPSQPLPDNNFKIDGQDENEMNDPQGSESKLVPPPPEELIVLHELARIGNMRRIRDYATHLESLGDSYGPFAEKLRELTAAFAEQEILALVEQYRS